MPSIEPYHPISLDPAAMVFHYAQESFEGMKAYRTADGRVLLFRPEKNAARLQSTHKRLCIPEIPVEDCRMEMEFQALIHKDRWLSPSIQKICEYMKYGSGGPLKE